MSASARITAPLLGSRFGTRSATGGGRGRKGMNALRCDELRQVASLASRSDDAAFLAARPGTCLVLIGPDRSNLRTAVVVPIGAGPTLKTLGRHPENDIVAPWPSISRRHAVVVA